MKEKYSELHETSVFLKSRGVSRISEQTFDLLSCLACHEANGSLLVRANDVVESGCMKRGTVYGVVKRLEQTGVVAIDVKHSGNPGRPAFGFTVDDLPSSVGEELSTIRPCEQTERIDT